MFDWPEFKGLSELLPGAVAMAFLLGLIGGAAITIILFTHGVVP